MARQAAHIKPAGCVTTGREHLWMVIRERKEPFTIADIRHHTGQNLETIRTYLTGLKNAGYVECVSLSTKVTMWSLINDVGVKAPRVTRNGKEVTQGRSRENMWRTIKIIKVFNYVDLAVYASTEAHPVNPFHAREYIKYLCRAGYLTCIKKAKPGNKPGTGEKALYRFLQSMNTGPRPPMIQRTKRVFDPNLDKVVWPVPGGKS